MSDVPPNEMNPASESISTLGWLQIAAGILTFGSAADPVLGWAMIAGGLFSLISGFLLFGAVRSRLWGMGLSEVLAAVLYLLLGVVIVMGDERGAAFLGLALGAYLLGRGVAHILVAARWQPRRGWRRMLVGGVVGILLVPPLFFQWAFEGIAAVALIGGLELIWTGITLIAISKGLPSRSELLDAAAVLAEPAPLR